MHRKRSPGFVNSRTPFRTRSLTHAHRYPRLRVSKQRLRGLDRGCEASEALLVERLFRGGEEPALLEADVVVEEHPQLAHLVQRELARLQPEGLATNREVL